MTNLTLVVVRKKFPQNFLCFRFFYFFTSVRVDISRFFYLFFPVVRVEIGFQQKSDERLEINFVGRRKLSDFRFQFLRKIGFGIDSLQIEEDGSKTQKRMNHDYSSKRVWMDRNMDWIKTWIGLKHGSD